MRPLPGNAVMLLAHGVIQGDDATYQDPSPTRSSSLESPHPSSCRIGGVTLPVTLYEL